MFDVDYCSIRTNLIIFYRNESVINFIVSTPSPYIVNTVLSGKNQHTSQYMAELTDEVITKYGFQKFLAVVTDNAPNMLGATRILTEKYPHMFSYGCIGHMINLIAGDVIKTGTGTALLNDAKDCVKVINNTQVLNSLFSEILKSKNINTSLKMPVPTRWGSTKDCFESVLLCKSALRSISISEEADSLINNMHKQKKTAFINFKTIVLSDEFWYKIESFLTILKPLQSWILLLERDSPTVELTCKAFKEIQKDLQLFLNLGILPPEENEQLHRKLIERKQLYLKNIHFAADLLRPQSLGSNLTPTELLEAMKCIEKIANDMGFKKNDISMQLAQYLNRELNFSDPYIWEKTTCYSSISWWKIFGKSEVGLSTVATRILSMPATSAATERSFKTQSLIHTKKRNRLDNVKVQKLTFVKHNLKLMRKKNVSSVVVESDKDNANCIEYVIEYEEEDVDWQEIEESEDEDEEQEIEIEEEAISETEMSS